MINQHQLSLRIVCTTILVETSPQALPLGAACIASALKHDERTKDKFSVELLSFSNEDSALTARTAVDHIVGGTAAPAFVCFSVYVWNRALSESIAALLKQQCPEVVTIAGGPEVTANPFNFEHFDYMVAGQGELAVPALIASLSVPAASVAASSVPAAEAAAPAAVPISGVYSRRDASLFAALPSAEQTKRLCSITRAPAPLPEHLVSPYLDGTLDPAVYEGALWELARGCPFQCSYCYESKGEKKIAYFPQERLSAELALFASKKIPQVFVLDPTYNADKRRALSMLNEIAYTAPNMFFYFEARAEFIDRELARAFTKIPCSLQIGLQSSSEEVLANVHRTMNKKQFIKNIGILNEEGVNFGFDLIYGLPGDTLSGFRASIDFAVSLYPNNIELFCLSVLPGTDLYERAAPSSATEAPLHLEFERVPPYHVLSTPTFPAADLARAATLAAACNRFYTQGRAVPWFNSVTKPLHLKPSVFFEDFAKTVAPAALSPADVTSSSACNTFAQIVQQQKTFITRKYQEKHLDRQLTVALDLITLHAALSTTTADGTEQTVTLHYHPDDLFSEYASDISFFATNAAPHPCKVCTFEGKGGADWKILK